MKLKITRIAVGIIFLLTYFSYTGSAQPGVGLPYSLTITSGAGVLAPPTTVPNFTAVFSPVSQDDSISKTIIPAAYTGFTYAGVNYPSFCVSTNGFVLLTTSATANVSAPIAAAGLPVNSLANNSTGLPIIAPLWDDLKSTPAYRWDVTNKIMWIRWTGVFFDKNNTSSSFAFAVGLYCAGSVSPGYIYLDNYWSAGYNYNLSPSVPSSSTGISGPCQGDYWSVRLSGTAADSSVDNILSGTTVALDAVYKQKGFTFVPKANIYDNCLQAKLLSSSPVSTTAFDDTLSNVHATASTSGLVSCSPGGTDSKDVWVKFVKPSGITSFNFNTSAAPCQPVAGTSVEIFHGSCAALVSDLCTTVNTGGTVNSLTACSVDTFFARITTDGDVVGKFKVNVQNPSWGYTCANPRQICALNYSAPGLTTANSVNDYTAANTPCASAFHGGNDYVFSYTPVSNECDSIYINGVTAGLYPGLFVYDGCPSSAGTHCIASSTGVTGASTSAVIRKVNLLAGVTYYIIVDNNTTLATAGNPSIPFNFYMLNNGTPPANDDCASVVVAGAYDFGNITTASGCAAHTKTGSTECASPSTGGTNPACGGFTSLVSNDVWYMFTSQIAGPIQINLTQGVTNPILSAGMAVYSTSCVGAIVDCQGAGTSLTSTVIASVGDVFYIRVWTTNAAQTGTFNLCVFDPSGAACSNAAVIPSAPYNSPAINTSGYGNEYTAANTPCASAYLGGQDFVFQFTTGASPQCLQISITGTGINSYPGLFLYDACPDVATNCVAFATGVSNLAVINKVTLLPSTTYYIVVDNNPTLAAGGISAIPFVLHLVTQTMPVNDDCAGAVAAGPYDFGNINPGASCAATTKAGNSDCSSPSSGGVNPSCGGFVAGYSGDVWYRFTSQVNGSLQINLTQGSGTALTNAGMAIYTGSCAGPIADCQGPGNSLTSNIITTAGTVYYIRIWSAPGSTGSFNLCVFDNSGATCATAVNILSLPFSAASLNTSGFGNEYTPANTPCASAWHNGPDYVFKYTTGAAAQCVQIAVTGTGANSYPGVFLYDACPDVAVHCVASATGTLSSSTSATITKVSLAASTTYYIIVDNNSVLGSASIPFSISISVNGSAPANDNICSATSLGTVDLNTVCSAHTSAGTTECASYSAVAATAPSCAGFTSGSTGDVWYSFVAGTATTAAVTLSPSGATPIQNAGMAVYLNGGNCALSLGNVGAGVCVGPSNSLSASNISLVAGFTYWIRVWSPNPSQAGTFTICVSDNCSANDEPCGAIDLTTPTTTCNPQTFSTACATPSVGPPGPTCVAFTLKSDMWFHVTVPANGTFVFNLNRVSPGMTDPVMQLYTSPTNSCSNLATLACNDDGQIAPNNLFSNIIQGGLIAGQSVWIRIWPYNTTYGQFTICVYQVCQVGVSAPFGDDPCSVPVTSTAQVSCTFDTYDTRCATHTTIPGNPSCPFTTGQSDVWMRFVVPASGQFEAVFQRGTVYDWVVTAYRQTGASCSSLTEVACNDDGGIAPNPLLPYIFVSSPTVMPGDTIYIRIFTYSPGLTGTGSVCIHNPCPAVTPPPNDDPCNAIVLPVNATCTYSGPYTNLCAGISVAPPAGCGGSVYHDVWFKVRVPASGRLDIDALGGTMTDGVMAVYRSPSAPTSCSNLTNVLLCDDNGSQNPQMPHVSITWTAGDTVYVRFWDIGGLGAGTFSLCATDPCPGGTNPNNLPCNAIPMSIGTYYSANNSCADNTGEPFVYPVATPNYNPPCWTNNGSTYFNTVWYSFVAPSTSVTIRTITGSLSNTQIALFSGTCNAPVIVPGACNDNSPNCGAGQLSSQLTATVTPGLTYYVVVDGYQALTGTFTIVVQDATLSNPPQPVQDCVLPASVGCEVTNVPLPGYPGYGNICDLPGVTAFGCFPGSGEGNSSFYTFTIDSTGTLFFDITPTSNGTNYDWVLWRIGTTANPVSSMTSVCNLLSSHATAGVPALPAIVGCNISTLAPVSATGMGPSGVGTSNGVGGPAYNAPLAVAPGETYLLMINNTSGTPVGYTLDFTSNSPINYGAPTTVQWAATSGNSWTNNLNWGCANVPPSCGISAFITTSPTSVVSSPSLARANDVLIDFNGRVQINPNDTLFVCGNFTQNGVLSCAPNSVVAFVGTGTQAISGSLTGLNKFYHVVINKPSGSVILLSDIDVAGSFTIANNTSVFNINGKYMKVAKNFTNVSGKSTFIGRGRSTVQFNGAAIQTITNGTDSTLFDRVVINNSGGGVLLSGANSSLYVDSSLTLTNGKINAPAPTEVVILKNDFALPAVGGLYSLIGGNASSYVIGKLKRFVSGPGNLMQTDLSFDYPVGDATHFELANIYWYYSNQFGYVTGYYTPWPTLPSPFGPAANECLYASYDTSNLLDNGYWTFLRSNGAQVGGKYVVSLHNTGFTNEVATLGAKTVAICDTAIDPYSVAAWYLKGRCVYASNAANTQRDSVNSAAYGGSSLGINFRFATGQQGFSPFPIELLYFTANPDKNGVLCSWETASEINNEYFFVERSNDGKNFTSIGRVKGFGSGTSTQPLFYKLFDKQPPCFELLYYRLKQVDIDGMVSYSDIVAVNCNNKDVMSLYPNPASTEVSVNFYQETRGKITVSIVDMLGKIVSAIEYDVQNGYNSIKLKIEDLPQGVYYMKLSDPDDVTNSSRQAKFLKY